LRTALTNRDTRLIPSKGGATPGPRRHQPPSRGADLTNRSAFTIVSLQDDVDVVLHFARQLGVPVRVLLEMPAPQGGTDDLLQAASMKAAAAARRWLEQTDDPYAYQHLVDAVAAWSAIVDRG